MLCDENHRLLPSPENNIVYHTRSAPEKRDDSDFPLEKPKGSTRYFSLEFDISISIGGRPHGNDTSTTGGEDLRVSVVTIPPRCGSCETCSYVARYGRKGRVGRVANRNRLKLKSN